MSHVTLQQQNENTKISIFQLNFYFYNIYEKRVNTMVGFSRNFDVELHKVSA